MFERLTHPATTARWGLSGAAAGSLALHALALTLAMLIVRSAHPATEDPATIVVFVPPEAAAPDAPPLPADFVPLPDDPPPPEFQIVDPKLPPPDEAPPPPDFKSAAPPPKPVSSPPPRPVQATPLKPSPAPASSQPPTQSAALAAPSAPASVAPNWNALLGAWLAAHRSYPPTARQRGEEGDVVVRFTVAAAGNVVDVAIVQASGHQILDDAALGMLRGASLPAPGTEATRTVRIRFRLSD